MRLSVAWLDIDPNQAGRVITNTESCLSWTEGVKLMVLVELTPVTSLELVKEQPLNGEAV